VNSITRRVFLAQAGALLAAERFLRAAWLKGACLPYLTAASQPQTSSMLYLQRPAQNWVDGFPIGNGLLGGMVSGNPSNDCIGLNHNQLWRRSVERRRIKVADKLPEFRRLFLAGRFEEAGQLMDKDIMSTGGKMYRYVNSFQPLGELQMDFSYAGEVADYQRQLDMNSGIVQVNFRAGDTQFRREYFAAARRDGVLVVRITSDRPHMIFANLRLRRVIDPECSLSTRTEDNLMVLAGRFQEGFPFAGVARVTRSGGRMRVQGDAISIEGASEVLVVMAMATGHESTDPVNGCKDHLNSLHRSFKELRRRHVLEHRRLFRRVRLSLGNAQPKQPADELVNAAVRTKQSSPRLIEELFNFGRYLMISGSRPGGLPMNLQGIWNNQIHPPWDSDYHLDINLEMNYWPAEVCNLSELAEPLFDWAKARIPDAKRQASDLYGCRGIYFCIVGDSTGLGNPDNITYSWPGAAGWLGQHFWRHWEYTGDRDFLQQQAYPFLKEVASFYEDYLVKNAQGKYRIVPSASPENPVKEHPGWTRWTTVSSTIDLEIAREVFTHLIQASEILKVDSDQAARWRKVLGNLPTPAVNQHGELLEWSENVQSDDPGHRHMSMFYGLFPGDRITPDESPALAAAARKALQTRLRHGYSHMNGWSYPWLTALFARLADGNAALAQLDRFTRGFVNDNLLSLITDHRGQGLSTRWFGEKDIFQIEAGLGTTAAIAEMLLQSQGGTIRILPALPDRWPAGSLSGLVARGGFVVDIDWRGGREERVRIHSRLGNRCRVKFHFPPATIALKTNGNSMALKRLAGNIIEFATTAGRNYELRLH